MKKYHTGLVLALFMISSMPSFATESTTKGLEPVNITSKEASVMLERIEEINKMDISSMSHKEKRGLRKEVKTLNKALRSSGGGGGIYISVGAAILIVLLLILLF